jgi:hypothetical protein
MKRKATEIHASPDGRWKSTQLAHRQRSNGPVTEAGFKVINDVFVIDQAVQCAGRLVSTPRTETQHTKIPRKHILAVFQCCGSHCHLSAIT